MYSDNDDKEIYNKIIYTYIFEYWQQLPAYVIQMSIIIIN